MTCKIRSLECSLQPSHVESFSVSVFHPQLGRTLSSPQCHNLAYCSQQCVISYLCSPMGSSPWSFAIPFICILVVPTGLVCDLIYGVTSFVVLGTCRLQMALADCCYYLLLCGDLNWFI